MKDRRKPTMRTSFSVVLVCLLSMLLLNSCATHIATRATQVRLVSALQAQNVEDQCEFLGNVTGTEFPYGGCLSWWQVWRRISYNNALNEMMKNAAELGATHMFANTGDYYDLRGEAFVCAYCLGSDEEPDLAYCLDIDGQPDEAFCMDDDGNMVGGKHCEGYDADNRKDCEACDGRWVPEIEQDECEEQDHTWVPRADNREDCERKGGTWLPVAKDQITCEDVKGGKWIINQDVLRSDELDVEGATE